MPPRSPLLPDTVLDAELVHLSGWALVAVDGGPRQLERSFTFAGFSDTMRFVAELGVLAETVDHHPEFTVSWGAVRVATWSHDAGGVTDRDVRLALAIDRLPSIAGRSPA